MTRIYNAAKSHADRANKLAKAARKKADNIQRMLDDVRQEEQRAVDEANSAAEILQLLLAAKDVR